MGRELTPAELSELLGAYVLDAVDVDEREQVEVYLARTPAAAAEVAELRETAALLAHVGREAPDGLWARIEGALAEEPPRLGLPYDTRYEPRPEPRSEPRPEPRPDAGPVEAPATRRVRDAGARRRTLARVGAVAASLVVAASIAVSLVLHGQMDDQQARIDRLSASVAHDGVARAAKAAVMDPASHEATLVSADGARRAKVVAMPDGTGFFMEHNLPKLAAGRTYQLWAMTGSRASPVFVSVGVLGRRPAVTAFRAGTGAMGFMVTVEAVPGVVTPDRAPMLEGFMT